MAFEFLDYLDFKNKLADGKLQEYKEWFNEMDNSGELSPYSTSVQFIISTKNKERILHDDNIDDNWCVYNVKTREKEFILKNINECLEDNFIIADWGNNDVLLCILKTDKSQYHLFGTPTKDVQDWEELHIASIDDMNSGVKTLVFNQNLECSLIKYIGNENTKIGIFNKCNLLSYKCLGFDNQDAYMWFTLTRIQNGENVHEICNTDGVSYKIPFEGNLQCKIFLHDDGNVYIYYPNKEIYEGRIYSLTEGKIITDFQLLNEWELPLYCKKENHKKVDEFVFSKMGEPEVVSNSKKKDKPNNSSLLFNNGEISW